MFINTILDEINIKSLPELIINYFRKNGEKKFSNLRNFYNTLLDYINEDVKESYLNRILKYLSSTTPSLINLFEDFNSDIYDKELQNFSKYLVSQINKYENYLDLYESINKNVNLIFYDKEEYLRIKESNNEKKYDLFIFLVIKHTFKTYQINLPGIISNRLFEEAMTTEYDSERRKRMIKASADLDNIDASILHASHLMLSDPNEAIDYLLKAKAKPYALWVIGFYIEKKRFSKKAIGKIEKELTPFFINDNFINKISSDNEDILLAVNIYYYIYLKYNFSKAINSIGKLLINNIIRYNNSDEETIQQAKIYLNMGIKLGNVNAITNLSVYYYTHPNDKEYDDRLIKKLLKTSAELGDIIGNYFYGKLMCEQGNKEGLSYLIYSAELGLAEANFELGKVYEANNDYIKCIECYKNAINLGYFDASINLCKTYIFLSTLYGKNAYLIYAKEVLDNNIHKISKDMKKNAMNLYKDVK